MSSYDPTLFEGTAGYYSRYRLGYPKELFDEIFKHIVTSKPYLLDIGCGPATITNAIIDRCGEAICVDPDEEMLEEAKRITRNDPRITFVNTTAEKFAYQKYGTFDLVTFGSSLHWMQSDVVIPHVAKILNPGGLIAVIYSKSAGMNIWQDDENLQTWQAVTTRLIQKYLGKERRAGSENFQRKRVGLSYEESLMSANELRTFFEINLPFQHTWSCESLIGLLYSASFCRKDYFKKTSIKAFECDLKDALLQHFDGADTWTETYDATAYVGIK